MQPRLFLLVLRMEGCYQVRTAYLKRFAISRQGDAVRVLRHILSLAIAPNFFNKDSIASKSSDSIPEEFRIA